MSRLHHRDTHELLINDYLRDDTRLEVKDSNPWYANIVNYMVTGYVAPGEDKRKLKHLSRSHLWDDPYHYQVCADVLLRRCVPNVEAIKIIERYHASPYGGHYEAFRTHAKIWQSGFFLPTMYQDTK